VTDAPRTTDTGKAATPTLKVYTWPVGTRAIVLCEGCAAKRGEPWVPTTILHFDWEVCKDCGAKEEMFGYPDAYLRIGGG
jgi:hypothetical protein